uniref:RING-type domain-containing protein n=1 Tax=Pyrodinium bahamense TaxID=73915 RepID=A0A7S0FYF1_9DINO|mmetsp:Transcript_53476/g.148214  ORF Transcript_53476/g.148214 Transcript_53476/m.148214 type:complete len:618 (+) Transcript_53476:61-1914(+)
MVARGNLPRLHAFHCLFWSFSSWRCIAAKPTDSTAQTPAVAEAVLPPAVVVHGRRGPNSSINGVYIRDYSWQGQIGPCYRRSGATGQKAIFLYFEGEWRMGPSPEEGSVWAYARSDASSPLQIGVHWQVWDGQRVVLDPELQVSDTSVIPSVLFLSFSGAGVPPAIRAIQGMLLQQPGLWDGRPYYRHSAWDELFLLCSVPEGRWRLGPLPVGTTLRSNSSLLFAASAASVPQDIVEPWYVPVNETNHLPLDEGIVRLSTTSVLGVPATPRHRYPRHLLVEGVATANGAANGVYRRAPELLNQRPVYHKTDALRAASLWFAGGDWRLGPSIESGRAWVYVLSVAFSPLQIEDRWKHLDGQTEEAVRIADAVEAIPSIVVVAGERYAQQQRLCDARPVYRRDTQRLGEADVFLFFRAHEGEWWLGPVVGGTECYARAIGSQLRVIPEANELLWRQAVDEELRFAAETTTTPLPQGVAVLGDGRGWDEPHVILGIEDEPLVRALTWCSCLALVVAMATCGVPTGGCSWHSTTTRAAEVLGFFQKDDDSCSSLRKAYMAKTRNSLRSKASSLACVVCLEAPREILLLPCRHVCCCKACADRLERCPVCREWKTAFTKVFL